MITRSHVMCMLVALLTPHAARAELVAHWRANSVAPAAIANDPALAGMQSWSLMATNTSGIYASTGLRAVLPPGDVFYRHPLGGAVRPTNAQISVNPALAFHTYVTDPTHSPNGGGAPSVLGGFPDDPTSPASFGGPSDTLPGTFAVAWGDPQGPPLHPTGTYEIARLTFPAGASPTVHPQSVVYYVAPEQPAPIPTTIPEPHTAIAAATGAAFIGRRRRRT
jgi:hypothetical protein